MLAPAVIFLLVLYVWPLARLVLVSLDAPQWTLKHYVAFLTESAYLRILARTFGVSATVTIICLVLGYPTAYVLARMQGRLRNLLLLLVIVPYLTSFLVRTYAWMVLLGPRGVVNTLLIKAGAIGQPVPLVYNAVGVHVGMVHVLLPLMILPLYSVMRGIDRNLLKAAQTMGADPFRAFFRVFLPLSAPGVGAGCLLVFLVGLGFYITPALLGGLRDVMLASLIEVQITQMVQWGFAATGALILLATTLAGYLLIGGLAGGTHGLGRGVATDGQAVDGEEMAGVPRGGGSPPHRNESLVRRAVAWGPRLVLRAGVGRWLRRRRARRWAREMSCTAPERRLGDLALATVVGVVFVFLILPTCVVIPISFSSADYLTFPPPGWGLKWYVSYFRQPGWIRATTLSLGVGLVTMVFATTVGTLAAYGVVRDRMVRPSLLIGFLVSPIIVPPIVIAVATYGILARWDLIGHPVGLVLGHSIGSVAYVVAIVTATLAGFDVALERAAMSLGAGPLRTFVRVTFPGIRAGVISAALFAFIHSFDELVITMFISGVHTQTLPMKMWEDIRNQIDPTIAAVSSLLTLVPVLWLVVLEAGRRSAGGDRDQGVATGSLGA